MAKHLIKTSAISGIMARSRSLCVYSDNQKLLESVCPTNHISERVVGEIKIIYY